MNDNRKAHLPETEDWEKVGTRMEPAPPISCTSTLAEMVDTRQNSDSDGWLGERTLSAVQLWSLRTLKSLILPGGIVLLAASLVFRGAFGSVPVAAVNFYYYAVFAAGLLLAWRFQSSRLLFSFLTLLLAHRAIEFFSGGRIASAGPGRIALEAIALLLPINFIVFSVFREWGLVIPAIFPRLGLLFFESVFVAIICRPSETIAPAFLRPGFLGGVPGMRIPMLALLAFIAAIVVLLLRFLLHGKPTESGMLWTLVAAFLSLQSGGSSNLALAYMATAGLILVSSVIENTYLLAYHDELTTLPGRRAFNEALLRLEDQYAIAVVDIDHFKKFNDIYGHETGDQVLRLVAARLADVTGGGRAYRVGGEEFSIVFPGKSVKEVLPHLEQLRSGIEVSRFYVRGQQERRSSEGTQPPGQNEPNVTRERRSTERRAGARPAAGSKSKPRPPRAGPVTTADEPLSVTVSIGVSGPDAKAGAPEQVIQAADKALYRAKQAGRNRVESTTSARPAKSRRSIA